MTEAQGVSGQAHALLSRAESYEHAPLPRELAGLRVIVTGAAGSIGSELCRQLSRGHPGQLVIVDQAETPLFYLDAELREKHPDLDLMSIVANVADTSGIFDVFARYPADRVFHAAAYKHVPLMESNPRSAVRNNVMGTLNVIRAAGRAGTGRMVLLSSDKAANPTGIMGITKRVSELLMSCAHKTFPQGCFCSVRFGNVWDTAGSVVEVFRRQATLGRPLTVTHPEATRFFITMDEAVMMLIETSCMRTVSGRITMLEMGETVPIVEIARAILERAGRSFVVGETVVYTGLRAGDRLHEIILNSDEHLVASEYDGIHLVERRNDSLERERQEMMTWLPALSIDPETAAAIKSFCLRS